MRAARACHNAATMEIAYDERGLVPVVIADWNTGEVLTLAYANAQAVALRPGRRASCISGAAPVTSCGTRARPPATRRPSRRFGSTATATRCWRSWSPPGPACHTGERTCFFDGELEPPAPHEALPGLERTLVQRGAERPAGSYTVELLDNPPLMGEKVQEEAEEVARAAREETDDRVDNEAADLLYHLTVLLHSRGRTLGDAERVLIERRS